MDKQFFSTPLEITNNFGEYWSNLSHDRQFHPRFVSNKTNLLNSNYSNNSPSYSLKQIDGKINLFEFVNVLSRAKGKTPGPMCLKVRILTLFNNIFESGIYPQNRRNATIFSIQKPNKPVEYISSYRPISLLPCIEKVFEKFITTRLM